MAIGNRGGTGGTEVGHGEILDVGSRAPADSSGKDFGRTKKMTLAGELGLHVGGATEDRLVTDQGVAVDLDVDDVGDDRRVELHRQSAATSRPS